MYIILNLRYWKNRCEPKISLELSFYNMALNLIGLLDEAQTVLFKDPVRTAL